MNLDEIINKMLELSKDMQDLLLLDIEDIKKAKHENLLERNEKKEEAIVEITNLKSSLNEKLVEAMQNGEDINLYRQKVDNLEEELKNLYKLNKQLASIVLPIQQMYKDIVEEIARENGGNLLDVKA
ncbi:hypothetical protein AMOL_2182 [Malaciobacter molluscorum LMG 25693]|uniref:Flagellar protein FlgN n=2 Tax=Malaciobacter molluscorum LMG 25693 TaxID=870501 RepID=A0AB33GZW3_9BACT|nr:hypothetical protein [Malaciobacter molluscorum]AXX93135.1 hypothetical protein AMOL_2182 [Malaciobacter molluscorum LMG 25693]